VTNDLPVNTVQLAGQAVTAAGGVTFPASVGTSTFATGQNVGTITGIVGTTLPATVPSAAQNATTLLQDTTTGDFTTAASPGYWLLNYLNAAVTSRMASYTQPTNFLLTTFPAGTVSSYAGADTAGTTTLLTRIPGTIQPQTGDSYARLGAPAGASVSADIAAAFARIGAPVGASISADIATKMASYTQPTGFLAAIFPTAVSSYAGGAVASVTAPVTLGTHEDTTLADLFAMLNGGGTAFTIPALANAPSGGGGATAAAIATYLLTDLMSGTDFQTAGSLGALFLADINAAIASRQQGGVAVTLPATSPSGFLDTTSIGNIWGTSIENGSGGGTAITAAQALMILSSYAAGNLNTTAKTFGAAGQPAKTRITYAIDGSGNRVIQLTLTP
jgi:hypothetical protein